MRSYVSLHRNLHCNFAIAKTKMEYQTMRNPFEGQRWVLLDPKRKWANENHVAEILRWFASVGTTSSAVRNTFRELAIYFICCSPSWFMFYDAQNCSIYLYLSILIAIRTHFFFICKISQNYNCFYSISIRIDSRFDMKSVTATVKSNWM